VPPSTTVRNALSLMLETGAAQVIVENDGQVLGAFTLDAARQLL
jgi:CBS domain-containing protein